MDSLAAETPGLTSKRIIVICVIAAIPIQFLMIGEVRIEAEVVLQCCVVILALGYAYVLVSNVGYAILRAVKVS